MVDIVTGASRGIGLAAATALLERGDTVIGSARNENDNIKALTEKYGNFKFIPTDISREEDRKNLVEAVCSEFGKIDLLVNNAGVAPKVRKDMLDITEEDFDFVTGINMKGTYFLTQEAAKKMLLNKSGRIINISSMSSYTASVNRAEYCIAKAAISMMTKLYTARLSPEGIGVFEIMPGIIETDMTSKVKEQYIEKINNGLTPINRMGQPEDIAKCVLAIAEGKLDFCVGTQINADGGFSVRRL